MVEISINQLVEDNLPAGFSVSQDYIDRRLEVWQLLLYKAAEIPADYMTDITVWSNEWRIVLAYCIIYDIYMKIISGNILFGGSSSDNEGISTGKDVKKITTGPTEVEYFNTKESWAELMKFWLQPGGLLELFFAQACMAAATVGVKLPFCAARNITMGPVVVTFKKPCQKLCPPK